MEGPQHENQRRMNGSFAGKSTHLLSGVSKLSPQCDRNRFRTTVGLYSAQRNGSLVCQTIPQLVHEGSAVNLVSRHSGISLKSSHYSLQLHRVKSLLTRWQSLVSQFFTLRKIPLLCSQVLTIGPICTPHESSPHHYTLFLKNYFNIIVLSVPKYFELYPCFTFTTIFMNLSPSCEVCVHQSHPQ